jgi:hypothetical protein
MATRQDPIPSLDALEAAARRDREETEDLLAGFDRPGRVPQRPRERDFVSHFAPRAKEPSPPPSSRRLDPPTVVVPRRRNALGKRPMPDWLPWAAAALLMVLFGGLVAFVATGDAPPASQTDVGPQPSSVTTIMSAYRTGEVIPPPEPPLEAAASEPQPEPQPEPAPLTAPRRAKREAREREAAPKPAQRDDFIRDL